MMSVLFAAMVGFSLVCALFQGHLPDLTQALLTGGSEAVTLLLRLAGGLCLWSGVMEVAVQSGLTRSLSQALLPITRRLFPELSPGSPALEAISMNLTADLLGLGEAAVPAGLEAMRALEQAAPGRQASGTMIRLVVLNTASFQLLPATIALLRAQHGSAAPLEILPAVWLTSLLSVGAGLLAAVLLERRGQHGR